jgi:hypothetical protein
MAHVKRGAAEPPVRLFDAPVRVPSRRALTLAVTLGTWALLVVTVPFYFVFLLNSLPELFAVMGTIRAAARSPHGTVDDAGGAQRGGAQRGRAQQTGADPSDD